MGYVWAGYGITLGSLAAYAVWLVRRARALDRRTR
jgi:heme exporter protein CcmD